MRVKPNSPIESVQVVADAEGLSSRAGTVLLAGVADKVGLTEVLSQAMGGVRRQAARHVHALLPAPA